MPLAKSIITQRANPFMAVLGVFPRQHAFDVNLFGELFKCRNVLFGVKTRVQARLDYR